MTRLNENLLENLLHFPKSFSSHSFRFNFKDKLEICINFSKNIKKTVSVREQL